MTLDISLEEVRTGTAEHYLKACEERQNTVIYMDIATFLNLEMRHTGKSILFVYNFTENKIDLMLVCMQKQMQNLCQVHDIPAGALPKQQFSLITSHS